MSVFQIDPLPYPTEKNQVSAWFSHFADTPGALWLDSAEHANGRFDVFTAHPALVLTQQHNQFTLTGPAATAHLKEQARNTNQTQFAKSITTKQIASHPATQLLQMIEQLRTTLYGTQLESQAASKHLTNAQQQWLPGVMGLLSYSVGSVDQALKHRDNSLDWPQAVLGFYAWVVVIDHQEKAAWLASHTPLLEQCEQQQELKRADLCRLFTQDNTHAHPPERTPKHKHTTATESISKLLAQRKPDAEYTEQFQQVKNYLIAGDCYQINLARRFQINTNTQPFVLYNKIRRQTNAPYSGFLNTHQGQCLCFSPEQFLTLDSERNIFTSPIKGTRPRSDDPETDSATAKELAMASKDRAENLMIVDLLRNDFGKFCEPHSIHVPQLMSVQSFATVHHLVSEVRGKAQKDISPEQVLAACFPGGSITGAPKKRAMQIIDELETQDRHAFCGSLCHIGANGTLNANICIRTGILQNNAFTLWAGGGIVIDSALDTEWIETLWKIQRILEACY